jgi:uncharacterized protein YggU (UPF0235/DUF167 family)
VEASSSGIVVRVRAIPEGGRANEEARRALADALGVTRSEITLLRGRASRDKVFGVASLSRSEALQRLQPD